ncbi:MAG: LysM peptidoglycan-binding domain-containing protein [Myxococcales bacterium]|nr:LysM peptidoglycan-binding domain-containing protein [Myxococcales bacterium]
MSLLRFTIFTLVVLALSAATAEVGEGENPANSETEFRMEDLSGAPPAARAPEAATQSAPDGRSVLAPAASAARAPGASRGRIGYDEQGRPGHVHTVARADTLWDISELYLGTAWVWPSIWQDNQRIENPHLIFPGDRIWISAYEMRRVSETEAAFLIANGPEIAPQPAAAQGSVAEEVATEMPLAAAPVEPRMLHVSARETSGLVTPDQLEVSASIVGKVSARTLLAQEDEVYVGLGEGSTEIGEEFTVVRTQDAVRDPDSGELLGYHVEILGWLEIESVFPETSLASIRMSTGEIALEDRLIPRRPLPPQIPLQPSPEGVEGKISFFPQERVLMGFDDFVYLNRGSLDGLEVGSPLEVYRLGYTASETSRSNERVAVPDRRVARMVVVRVDTQAAVALVTSTNTELEIGDRFRGAR